MVFDQTLSSTVSLSRILDVFIEDNENPSTILYFLKDHQNCLKDILKFSDHSPRLFSIDFITRCSIRDVNLLTSLITEDNMNEEIQNFIWMVFSCDGIPSEKKMPFKKHLVWLRDKSRAKHPHTGCIGRYSRMVDLKLCHYPCKPIDYALAVNELSLETVESHFHSWQHSLLTFRVLQSDVFQYIEPSRQYVILSKLGSFSYVLPMHKCIKQLLYSDFHSDMKFLICSLFDSNSREERFGFFDDEIENTDSFNHLCMKLQISGDDVNFDWIFYFILVKRGLDFMKGASLKYEKIFHEYFDVYDILKQEKSNGFKPDNTSNSN